jgi:hypothetical protein
VSEEGAVSEREAALREQVRRLRERPGIELKPAGAYEAVTRQMVESLAEELREIKNRVGNLIWMIVAAIVIDVVLRIAGLE